MREIGQPSGLSILMGFLISLSSTAIVLRILQDRAEFDSLSDFLCFGVAPAFILFFWSMQDYRALGFAPCLIFAVCMSLRLARFNVQINTVEKGQFNGLPIPAAAVFVASMILLFYYLGGSGSFKHFAVLLTIYVLAFLMVSTVKFNSFKDLEPFRRRPFNTLVVFVFLALLLAAEPQVMIFVFAASYILSGPVGEVVGAFRRRRRGRSPPRSRCTSACWRG